MNIDFTHTVAVTESKISDRDTARKGNTGQVGALEESVVSNASHVGEGRDKGQVGTALECGFPDMGDRVRKSEGGRDTAYRVLNQSGLGFVEQDSVQTAIVHIFCLNHHIGQGVGFEGSGADGGDAVGNCDVGQATIFERTAPDSGNTIWERHAGQARAPAERSTPDVGNAVWDRQAVQTDAKIERRLLDASNAIGDGDVGKAVAACKRAGPNGGHTVGYRHAGQEFALPERLVLDVGDAVGDRDAGEPLPNERIRPDAGDRQPVDGAGDDNDVAGPLVSRDRNRSVVIRIGKILSFR